MIKLVDLTKVYRTLEIETLAVNNINIEIKEGEFIAIMGPSGCGKTTLLNILGLIDNPTNGDYNFLGNNISSYNEKQKAILRKENIGFVFQNFNLIDELSVFENVELPLIYQGYRTKQRKIKVNAALEHMKMMHRRNHFPVQLSGGQQQRVAVARAIVNEPKLILADEPTGNLDSIHGKDIMEILEKLNTNGTTVIMVTHSQRDALYCKRIVHLLDGKIITENISANHELILN